MEGVTAKCERERGVGVGAYESSAKSLKLTFWECEIESSLVWSHSTVLPIKPLQWSSSCSAVLPICTHSIAKEQCYSQSTATHLNLYKSPVAAVQCYPSVPL